MQKVLKEFGGWPIIEGDEWNEEESDMTSILTKLQMHGVMSIFRLDIRAATNREKFMIMVSTIIYIFIIYWFIQNSQGTYTANLYGKLE